VATVLGGALAHLALGSLYCFANFQSYLPKHLLFLDGADRAGNIPIVMGTIEIRPCGAYSVV
jgi:hypothetical protein